MRPAARAQAAALCAPASAALFGGCSDGVLAPAGPIGRSEVQLLLEALAVMLAIVGPVIAMTLGFAIWFRASNARAKYRPDWAYDGRIEFVVWVIPVLVVLFLGAIAWVGAHRLDPYEPIASRTPPLEVEVIALDWKWVFIYPRLGAASVNELALPVGTPVHFRLTSGTVMNAFFIPRLGTMIYVMPGMVTQLNLRADRVGRFSGLSTMFSGDGFADMGFTARALDPAGFAAWLAHARAGGVLNAASFRGLAAPGPQTSPQYWGAVEPGLFDAARVWSMQTPRPRRLSHGGSMESADGPPTPDPAEGPSPTAASPGAPGSPPDRVAAPRPAGPSDRAAGAPSPRGTDAK